MQDIDNGLRDISQIRSMMETATKFLSLSSLSGISAGLIALAGAWIAEEILSSGGESTVQWLVLLALAVLLLAVGTSLAFSRRMAKKKGLPFWNATARKLVLAMMIPLSAGGAFCIVLLAHGLYVLIPGTMLLFYGLALVNGSTFTLGEVRYLGLLEILLGVAAGFWIEHGLTLWAIGFGLLHIVYGIVMYFKYERETTTRTAG
ncbi:MAG: hypothetical protein WBG01_14105 [Bacteroidota bacterium]